MSVSIFVKHDLKGALNYKARNLPLPPSPAVPTQIVTEIVAIGSFEAKTMTEI